MRNITNHDEIIDSRDLRKFFEDESDEQTSLIEEYKEAKEESDDDESEEASERLCNAINALSSYWEVTPEEAESGVEAMDDPADSFNGNEAVHALKLFIEELEGYGDFDHGGAIIRDSYFETYAKELAEDIGSTKADESWPHNHIDWEAAAEALKVDYMSAEWDGVEYWMRA